MGARRTVVVAIAVAWCFAALVGTATAAVERYALPDVDGDASDLLFEPDGDLRAYYTLQGSWSKIARLTPGGVVTAAGPDSFPLPGNARMARSSDGALWVIDRRSNTVYRLDPDGTWKSDSVGPNTWTFNGLATGPDGGVYSTTHAEQVTRHFVDASSELWTESFDPAPGYASGGDDLAFLDGRIYSMGNPRCTTAEDCAPARLVEIDPAAPPGEQRREISISALDYITGFWSIVAGPDGRLWVHDASRPRTIHRFTPAGADAPLTLPPAATLRRLSAGPAGSVLAVTDEGALARVRPDGTLTEWCPLDPELAKLGSGHDHLIDAVTGPDGAIWFSSRGEIGRLTLDTRPETGCAAVVESTTAQETGTPGGRPETHLSAEIVRGGGRLPTTSDPADPDIPHHGVRFEIGKTLAYGRTVQAHGLYERESGTYQTYLHDLEAGQTYHARAVVTTRFGTVAGPDTVFTTPPPPSVQITGERIQDGFPTIDFTVDPLGSATEVRIEYGPTAALGSTRGVSSLSADAGSQPITFVMDGGSYAIRSQPEFHYRLIATNGRGATTTAVRSIAVPPWMPPPPDNGTRPPVALVPQPGLTPVGSGSGPGSPSPSPAAGDVTGPSLRIPASNKTIRASKSGVVRFTVGPVDENTTGILGIKTAKKVRPAAGKRRRVIALGTAAFQTLDGQTATVRITLNKANRRLLRRVKRLRVQTTITLRDAHGNATIRKQTSTLKAPRT